MRRIIFGIMLLGCMMQGAFAQNLGIKGLVKDGRNKEPLEFANVVLQTMDSVFVLGTTTDGKGSFVLDKVKAEIICWLFPVWDMKHSMSP